MIPADEFAIYNAPLRQRRCAVFAPVLQHNRLPGLVSENHEIFTENLPRQHILPAQFTRLGNDVPKIPFTYPHKRPSLWQRLEGEGATDINLTGQARTGIVRQNIQQLLFIGTRWFQLFEARLHFNKTRPADACATTKQNR
jgi:hypothetical protein